MTRCFGLQGGVSLDMEKAFDKIDRKFVHRALSFFALDPGLLKLAQSWLAPHKYCIPFKRLIGHVTASRGTKQGSKDAPLLWTLVMSYILLFLKSRFSLSWLHEHRIIYADDVHQRWIISSHPQALNALAEFQHVLDVLKAYGLQINMTKSVATMRLVGRETPAFHRHWVHRSLPSTARERLAPAFGVQNRLLGSDYKL